MDKKIQILTNQTSPPIREVATKSIYTLRIQQNKLEQASFRLKERDRILFETCMGALKKNNKEKAAMCATEIAEVRKLVKFLYNVQLAIERVVMRLETIKELGDIVSDLKPALKVAAGCFAGTLSSLPDVSSELNNVNSTIQETLHATKFTIRRELGAGGQKDGGRRRNPQRSVLLHGAETCLKPCLSRQLSAPAPVKEKTPIREMVALTASSSQVFSKKIV